MSGATTFHRMPYQTVLRFRHTNHAGETADRTVMPTELAFGRSGFHPEIDAGWFMVANALDRDGSPERHFPLEELLQPPSDVGEVMAGRPRSSGWRKVRQEFISKHPRCAACGTDKFLNVHHVVPFHLDPDRELDPSNLMTLCEVPSRGCHFAYGHLYDWRAYNPRAVEDAAKMLIAVKLRRYALED